MMALNMKLLKLLAPLALITVTLPAVAGLEAQRVTDNVYALVGEMGQRSAENLANNATFGVLVTAEGVVLVDPGGSYKGAEEIATAVRAITEQPIKWVINSGGQDHRWLGNGYFKARGARLVASAAAVADQRARTNDQLLGLDALVGEKRAAGTEPHYADEWFEHELDLNIGGVAIEIRHLGAAHTPGHSFVWLPGQRVLFTGDAVYVERMLGVGSMSNSRSWIEVFEAMAALEPLHVIPGHGHATDLATATKDTYDYLQLLRREVGRLLDEGAGMEEVSTIDQSRFSYLKVYEEIKGRNAQQVYAEMEFE